MVLSMNDTPDILKKILSRKAEEIVARAEREDIRDLSRRAEATPPTRGFVARIRQRLAVGKPAVIAELKKASPSKGVMREDFRPASIAKSYEEHGATCLSVLTDRDFFQGSDNDLQAARNACSLPVIRKDFIIDPYQVYEARAIGADCILLIVAALGDAMLRDLVGLAEHLTMDVLVEVHDASELARVQALHVPLIGVNNRNLRTFHTDLQTTLGLRERVPKDRIVVTESGIHRPEDVALMRRHGVDTFLVGEAFMCAQDPGEKLAELFAT